MKQLLDDRRLLIPVLLTAVTIAVGATLIVFLAGDAATGGSAAADPPSSAKSSGAAGVTQVDIANFKFAPPTLAVEAGARVRWTNNDGAPHTASADGSFDTGDLKKGESATVKLDKPGSYSYVCRFHAFMTGTVTVK